MQKLRLHHRIAPLAGRLSWHRSIGRVMRLGFSRQAALAATRRLYPVAARTPARQALSLLAGSTLIGAGVGLFLNANLGTPPFDVLISSVSVLSGLSHGQSAWALSAGLFLVAALLGRPPSAWGLAYVFANGVAVDVVSGLIRAPESLVLRASIVGVGTLLIACGISVVVHSCTTGGCFELLMAAAADRGLNASRVRLGLEVGVVVAGVALGGSFGLATVFFAILIAPLLRVIEQALQDHSVGRHSRLTAQIPAANPVASAVRELEPSY